MLSRGISTHLYLLGIFLKSQDGQYFGVKEIKQTNINLSTDTLNLHVILNCQHHTLIEHFIRNTWTPHSCNYLMNQSCGRSAIHIMQIQVHIEHQNWEKTRSL